MTEQDHADWVKTIQEFTNEMVNRCRTDLQRHEEEARERQRTFEFLIERHPNASPRLFSADRLTVRLGGTEIVMAGGVDLEWTPSK